MKVVQLLVIAVAVACVCSTATAQVFSEDFESYAPGSDLQGVNGWKGWDNTASASAPVSDAYAFSGTNSVEIVSSADLVHEFDVAGGKWVFSTMMFIPSGTTGTSYFILLNSYDDGANQDWSVQITFDLAAGTLASYYVTGSDTPILYDEWVELKLVIDLDNDTVDDYYNGTLFATHEWDDNDHGTIGAIDLYGNSASSVYYDNIVLQSYAMTLATARAPEPANLKDDARRDVVLAWEAGYYAVTHDVYFGTDYDAVSTADRTSPMGVLVSQGQAATSFDPDGLLELGQTYYWRVDEVNAAPDTTIFKGDVWTLTAEPFVYPIENITATSNTTPEGDAVPANTVNGSGLNADDQHSRADNTMWLGVPAGTDPVYIAFEFDRVYKLYEMLVWNYNGEFEQLLSFGIKDVTVEYSTDGAEWTTLGDITLAQGTAQADYVANTTIDFGGAAVKFVRLTANSSYGMFGKYGLSEVRFLYLPAHAREPQPANETADVAIDSALSWRPGREAVSHDLYLGTDPEALALAATTTVDSYTPDALDLDTTYYWQVDEVNDAEAITSWEGALWSFTTEAFIVVDDFESYTDDEGSRIYESWADGWVNDTGSIVGYFEEPFAELDIVHGGSQALPLFYDNGSASTSEADLTLSQDWTTSSIKSLSLYFYGEPDNTGELFVTINGTKVAYDGDASDIARPTWQVWNIDLSTIGVNLSNVTKLTVGVEGSGAEGVLYIDDVRLYPKMPEYVTPTDPDPAGLVLYYALDEGSGNVATDSSGSGNNGTIEGSPTWITGFSGRALSFDGTEDYIASGKGLLSDLTAFSIACWLKADLSTASRSGLVGQNDCVEYGAVSSNVVQIWTSGSGSVNLDWPYTGAADWHHIVAVGNGNALTIYLDGKFALSGGSAITNTYGSSSYSVNIAGGGVFDATGNWLDGDVDEVYVYQRALSAAEVAGLAGVTYAIHKPF